MTAEVTDRFLRDARAAIKLRHPNIAQLHDFAIDEEGTAYIVTEFIQGLTLEEALAQEGPPPVELTLTIARQAGEERGQCIYLRIVPATESYRPKRICLRDPFASAEIE